MSITVEPVEGESVSPFVLRIGKAIEVAYNNGDSEQEILGEIITVIVNEIDAINKRLDELELSQRVGF